MTFCLKDKAMTDYSYFPQTAPTDDAKKITSESHGSNTFNTRPTQHRKDLTESTGVVPVKDPPKVKLEESSNNVREYEL